MSWSGLNVQDQVCLGQMWRENLMSLHAINCS